MLTNQQQNLKSSLYNAIYKWTVDNADEIENAFITPFCDMTTGLMAESAFCVILSQHYLNIYHRKIETDFSE